MIFTPDVHGNAQRRRLQVRASVPRLPAPIANLVFMLIRRRDLRSLSMATIAARLRQTIETVKRAAAELALRVHDYSGEPRPFTVDELAAKLPDESTLDSVLADYANATAPSASSPSPTAPRRRIYVPRPSVLGYLLAHTPDAYAMPWALRWRAEHGVGLLPRGDVAGTAYKTSEGPPPGLPGSATPSTFQWYWIVVSGDNPSAITKTITGDEKRYPELIQANPSKPTRGDPKNPYSTGYNFVSLNPGDTLYIPRDWNQYITVGGVPSGGAALPPASPIPTPSPVPSPGGGGATYAASLPAGSITAIKLELGAWGKREGTITGGYPGPFDLNDVIDEPFTNAVRSFQTWSNSKGTSLRTDGWLDSETHKAIDAYTVAATKTATAPIPSPSAPPSPAPVPALPPLPAADKGKGGTVPGAPGAGSSDASASSGAGLALLAGAVIVALAWK
jgi:hypothetical protein